ncbi:MAG: DNA/RNA nuclease SfsA [Candidatus Marinimicrobia bacterium]|jgi:sugar fermentation stimulation protein A|nr:DNA/RNA nuclease SfsA [Candidatus Neomarinimicrobiota bacterium]
MKIKGPLIKGRFVDRPNRFLVIVKIKDKYVKSHLPDPGRLKEILTPGRIVFLRKESYTTNRKTKYTTVLTDVNGELVSLISTLPNQFIRECIELNYLSFLDGLSIKKQEIKSGKHRFDFLLTDKKNMQFYLEVKSVTYVENKVARFPDAITERGTRHVNALSDLVNKGFQAGIIFVVQRSDANIFQPMWDRDSKFCDALYNAKKCGVSIWCIKSRLSKADMTFISEIPINLEP